MARAITVATFKPSGGSHLLGTFTQVGLALEALEKAEKIPKDAKIGAEGHRIFPMPMLRRTTA